MHQNSGLSRIVGINDDHKLGVCFGKLSRTKCMYGRNIPHSGFQNKVIGHLFETRV